MRILKIPKKLESSIEKRFVERCAAIGCITRKLNGLGSASWPDRLVLCPGGVALLIELKRPGGRLTPGQRDLHERLRFLGHDVATFDDVDAAIEYVRKRIR